MTLRNKLKICLMYWKSKPQDSYKPYAYKKHVFNDTIILIYT